ncbi:MAG: hypothetical protein SFW35_07055 [Chitinophagales bacterium]|nr:hypothetical protein [Chitinophagales bacterium]
MKKEFDAVLLQRDIREKLGKEYTSDPELRTKRLSAIRKKYGLVCKERMHNKK